MPVPSQVPQVYFPLPPQKSQLRNFVTGLLVE
jgi:hypothetical protein